MNLKELLEARANLSTQITEMAERCNDPEHNWTDEDEQAWTRANEDYIEHTRKIEKLQRAQQITTALDQPAGDPRNNGTAGQPDGNVRNNDPAGQPDGNVRNNDPAGQPAAATEEQRALALSAWCRHQAGFDLRNEETEALEAVRLNPNRRNLDLDLSSTRHWAQQQQRFADTNRRLHSTLEQRALSAVSGTAGGVTVPEGFINSLEVNMLAFSGILQAADIMVTNSGEDLPWPTVDDTGNEGIQIGESTAPAEADPTFGSITFGAYKFSSKMVKVPVELLEDSAFNLVVILGAMLGERLGRILNSKFTTGLGGASPKGIVPASTLGVTAASATAIVADELFDLEHSVDPAYRTNNPRYMFHDDLLLEIRKLKDSQSRYLFQNNLSLGAPDTINGRGFVINQKMENVMASGNKTMLFGELSKYKVRQVRQIRLRRLVERFADTDQEGFVAFIRADGNLLDAGTAPVKHLIH